jgi:hypothetical protein
MELKEEPQQSKEYTKEELIETIKEWIKIDTELTRLKSEVKMKSAQQKNITASLLDVMKKGNIDCFDINGGSLLHQKRKTKKPISGKYLISQLEEYYKDSPEIAQDIAAKILENRGEVLKETIKRKIIK